MHQEDFTYFIRDELYIRGLGLGLIWSLCQAIINLVLIETKSFGKKKKPRRLFFPFLFLFLCVCVCWREGGGGDTKHLEDIERWDLRVHSLSLSVIPSPSSYFP